MPSIKRITSKQRVLWADQSPMNPLRWCLTLECKHEVWKTAKSKPCRPFANCPQCADKVRQAILPEAELEHLSDKANIKPARGWMGNRGQFDPGD